MMAEKSRKMRSYLKARGAAGYVDAAPMQARIRDLYDNQQVSFRGIAERTGVDVYIIRAHYHGKAIAQAGGSLPLDKAPPLTTCHWATHNAVMSARFGPEDVRAWVPAHGTMRRLQALIAAGYPQSWLTEQMGGLAHLNEQLRRKPVRVAKEQAAIVRGLYAKYIDVDPLTAGVGPHGHRYAKLVAARRGFAPAACWDDDTIDDASAVPQWTGACGTREGRRIHKREGIPMCRACRIPEDDDFSYGVFRPELLLRAMKRRGVNQAGLADEADLRPASISSYTSGRRAPSTASLERMADVLRVRPEELCD